MWHLNVHIATPQHARASRAHWLKVSGSTPYERSRLHRSCLVVGVEGEAVAVALARRTGRCALPPAAAVSRAQSTLYGQALRPREVDERRLR